MSKSSKEICYPSIFSLYTLMEAPDLGGTMDMVIHECDKTRMREYGNSNYGIQHIDIKVTEKIHILN